MATSTTALGKTRFDVKGTWNSGLTYTADDIVFYNGTWFRASQNVPAATLPTNTTFWGVWSQSFNWRGTHVNTTGTTYKLYDTVKYTSTITNATFTAYRRSETEVYVCIADHTCDGTNTYLPLSTTYWQPISIQNNRPNSITVSTGVSLDNYGVWGQDPRKAIMFSNKGIVGESTDPTVSRHYALGVGKHCTDAYNSMNWITADGQVQFIGNSTNGSSGMGHNTDVGPASTSINFFFHDWFRSTSNGGSGVHYTPDNQPPRCIQLEQGYGWAKALFNNGEVYSWGYGAQYNNGDRSTSQRNMPVRCGGTYTEVAVASSTTTHTLRDTRIVRISAACGHGYNTNSHHTLALDDGGGVWAWGYNAYGQCGNGTTTNVQVPTKITQTLFNSRPVTGIWAFGGDYAWNFAVNDLNVLYVWGANHTGQLGTGSTSTGITTPVAITGITWDETAGGAGFIRKIVSMRGVNVTGQGSTAILTSKGRVYVAGSQPTGQFMIASVSQTNTWTQCTSGPGSSAGAGARDVWLYGDPNNGCMMVRDNVDGTTWVAGYNGQYLLGDGTSTNSSIAIKARRRERGQTIDLLNVKGLAHISCGTYQSAMVYTDTGWIYGVGYSGSGQLSLGQQPTWNQSVASDGNGYEHEGSQAFWLPARVPSSMLGKVTGIISSGTKNNAANNYAMFWIMTSTGRLWVVGDGGSSGCASLGQVSYSWGQSDANHNLSVFRAVMQE